MPLEIETFVTEIERLNKLTEQEASAGYFTKFFRQRALNEAVRKFHLPMNDQSNEFLPLHYLATKGEEYAKLAPILLSHGANPAAVDRDGRNIFHQAAGFKNPKLSQEIVTFLQKKNDHETLKQLVNQADAKGDAPLIMAVCNGDKENVKIFLSAGADPNFADELTLLEYALSVKNEDVVRLLLDGGANAKAKFMIHYLLIRSEEGVNENILKMLVENEADINSKDNDGYTPLSIVVLRGDGAEVIRDIGLLVACGAKVDGASSNFCGTTLLHCASSGEVVKLLCDYGADPDIKNEDGVTPISSAMIGGRIDVAEELIARRVDITTPNKRGFTPLQEAIFLDDPNAFLSKRITDKNERDDFIRANQARFVVGLAYSTDEFGFASKGIRGILKKKISEIQFSKKEKFLEILEKIRRDEPVNFAGGELRVMDVGYQWHAASFIIQYDDKGVPRRLSYCDGNLVLEKKNGSGYAEISFDLDQEKLKNLQWSESDFAKKLKIFSQKFHDTYSLSEAFNQKKFYDLLSEIVVCDAENKPIIVERNIPTKAQKRGNCSYKNFNIDMRAILRRVDPEMVFEMDDSGQNCGAGYEAYQEYKKALIKKNLEDLLELAGPEHKEKCYHQDVIATLRDVVFLQAVAKADMELLTKLAEIFAREGVDVAQIKNKKGKNAMFFAAKAGSEDVMKWCGERGVKQERDLRGNYPIHYVKNAGELDLLLKHGSADINACSESGYTCLDIITGTDDKNLAKLLLDKGAVATAKSLILPVAQGREEMVQLLLDHKADFNVVSDDGFSPLCRAILADQLRMAELLIDDGDVDITLVGVSFGATPFICAVMLCYGARDKDEHVAKNQKLIAEKIFKKAAGENIIGQKHELLHCVFWSKDLELAELVLKAGFDVLSVGKDGDTALHHAILSDDFKMVELLLAHGAANDLVNKGGKTPKQLAEEKGFSQELIEKISLIPSREIEVTEVQSAKPKSDLDMMISSG